MIRNLMFLLALWGSLAQCAEENPNNTAPTSKSGLLIDNGINRGISYTDPLGNDYNLRYIPIAITNDSTRPVHLQIAFSKEYDFPTADGAEQFKLIPLPKEWALEGVDITDSMIDELPQYINQPLLNITLAPHETSILAIGTLFPRPPRTGGVLPKTLFAFSDGGFPADCDWLREGDQSSNTQNALGLKLTFSGDCRVIPCGYITHPER